MEVKEVSDLKDLSVLTSWAKSTGFVYQSSAIYGGQDSSWDYGPLGALLKINVKKFWWNSMTRREDIVGLDSAILMNSEVWKASGHVDTFEDLLVDCKNCRHRFREDHGAKKDDKLVCPQCRSGDLTEPRAFNLMFDTSTGPVKNDKSLVYLRPETAQGIFVNFKNVQQSTRMKVPFGVAQIGKAFRNEVTPGPFTFRTREFEQMEMQYFVKPGTDEKFFEEWKQERMNNYIEKTGLRKEKLRFHEHSAQALAHYAKAAFDVEYEFPFAWGELEGLHNRSDFDLSQHQKFSKKKLLYADPLVPGEKYIPYVIETSVGCDRLILALLCDAYREQKWAREDGGEDMRVVLALHPRFTPYKVACFPLEKNDGAQSGLAQRLRRELSEDWDVTYDDAGNIGKRYRRQDEVGTPLCLTVDKQSADDQQVTVRHRDTMAQDRVPVSELKTYIHRQLESGTWGLNTC